MSESLLAGSVGDVLARLEADFDALDSAALDSCADGEIVDALRRVERLQRRQAVLDQRLIAQVDERSIWFANGCASVPVFLRMLLRISPAEARARHGAARALGPQRTVPGVALEGTYPAVSAAQAAGEISVQHAAAIVDTITKLPDDVAAEFDRTIETILVDFARDHDPVQLRRHAEELRYLFDQDGKYHDIRHCERLRDLRLRDNADGSAHLDGELTAECAERLRVVFDALGKPRPAEDGTLDPRTPGQRRHNALLDWLRLVERTGALPKAGGVAATVLLTMDVDAYGTGTGTARTGHGYTVPADVAKTWAEPEARIILTLLSATKGIEAYSTVQRIFTEQQRLAMAARDRGCSFPHCDAPASWADAHHVTDWKDTHRTSVDDGALVCGKNHDSFQRMGFRSIMRNGRPHWVPPPWIDPDQEPLRNTMHDA